MIQQSDAEFIAELKAPAEKATCSTSIYKLGLASRTAIPRLIAMVEAEKKRADDSDAALAMANSLYAESELHVIHRAEIRHILADLIELISEFGARHGVVFNEPEASR